MVNITNNGIGAMRSMTAFFLHESLLHLARAVKITISFTLFSTSLICKRQDKYPTIKISHKDAYLRDIIEKVTVENYSHCILKEHGT